jgi:hypothetical protein
MFMGSHNRAVDANGWDVGRCSMGLLPRGHQKRTSVRLHEEEQSGGVTRRPETGPTCFKWARVFQCFRLFWCFPNVLVFAN